MREKPEQIDTEILELPENLVEQLVCKQLLNPLEVENSMFIQQNFKAQWFKNEDLIPIFQICRNYWMKYNNPPTDEIIFKVLNNDKFKDKKDKLTNIVNQLYEIDESKYDKKYLQDALINFTKGRAIYYAILDNIDDIEKNGDIGNCLSRFEDIVKIGINDDLGIEYFENIDNHIKDLTSKEQRVPFNWKDWDKYTFGGIPVGEACLFIIMAQPGLGKSQLMMNCGYQYLMQNKNVLMVSLEMSEKMYSRRMSALFSDINVNQLKDSTEILKKKVTITKLNNPKARLYIKQYSPNEFNSIKLKHLINKLKESKNFVPDLVIVDYLNIMSTNNSSYHMNSYERVGTISKELRSVSIETKIPILSATQANRCLFESTLVHEKYKGNIKIRDVNIGDQLLTSNGLYNKVIKKYNLEMKKTYQITTKSKKTIICTDIHQWPTNLGIKSINTGLKVGDKLFKKSFFICIAEKIGKIINKLKRIINL